jgi:hypothetical protein
MMATEAAIHDLVELIWGCRCIFFFFSQLIRNSLVLHLELLASNIVVHVVQVFSDSGDLFFPLVHAKVLLNCSSS